MAIVSPFSTLRAWAMGNSLRVMTCSLVPPKSIVAIFVNLRSNVSLHGNPARTSVKPKRRPRLRAACRPALSKGYMVALSGELVRGLLIVVGFGGLLGWLIVYSVIKADDPARMIFKWILTAG